MAEWYHVSSKDTGTAILMAGCGCYPAMKIAGRRSSGGQQSITYRDI